MNTLVGAALLAAGTNVFLYVLLAILIIVVLIIFFTFVPVGLWISASASGVKIGLFDLVGMRIRKVSAADIVNPMIKATKAGLEIPMNKLEAHYLAKGGKVNGKASVNRVVDSLIAAQRAGIPLDFERSCAIDLAGRDVLNAVQMSRRRGNCYDGRLRRKPQRGSGEPGSDLPHRARQRTRRRHRV